MLQALQESNEEWEAQIRERRFILVNEDIEAAKKQIASLQKQKKQLNKQYLDLEFHLDELQSNLELLEHSNQMTNNGDTSGEADEGTFFTLLSELEGEEAALQGEIQSYKDLQRSNKSNRAKYIQANARLQKELDFDKTKLDREETKLTESKNLLAQLQTEYDSKSEYLTQIVEKCTNLQTEELRINEELSQYGRNVVNELKEIERNQQIEYQEAVKEQNSLKKGITNKARKLQNEVDGLNKKLSKNYSVTSWKGDRQIIAGKIRKAKQQLLLETDSLETATKRRDHLSAEIKKALGNDDPGDCTGMRAKQIVKAEIDSLDFQNQPEVDEERQIERHYHFQLNEELKLIDKSLTDFQRYREATLKSLQEELNESTQVGYLQLLRSEMNELQELLTFD